jgi:hypothetical protein
VNVYFMPQSSAVIGLTDITHFRQRCVGYMLYFKTRTRPIKSFAKTLLKVSCLINLNTLYMGAYLLILKSGYYLIQHLSVLLFIKKGYLFTLAVLAIYYLKTTIMFQYNTSKFNKS